MNFILLFLMAASVASIKDAKELTMSGRMGALIGMFIIFPLFILHYIGSLFFFISEDSHQNILFIIISIALSVGIYFLYFHNQLLKKNEYRILNGITFVFSFLLSLFFTTWEYLNISIFATALFVYIILYKFHYQWRKFFVLSFYHSFLL